MMFKSGLYYIELFLVRRLYGIEQLRQVRTGKREWGCYWRLYQHFECLLSLFKSLLPIDESSLTLVELVYIKHAMPTHPSL